MRQRKALPIVLLLVIVAAQARAEDDPPIPPPWAEKPAPAPRLKWIGSYPNPVVERLERQEDSHTPASEKALDAALNWIAEHQMPDGGWGFDLRKVDSCQGRCSDSGKMANARVAPTCMALALFLAADSTPKRGKYKGAVKSAQLFLLRLGKQTSQGTKFQDQEGNAVDQALATMVLSDAYALTRDSTLADHAQRALDQLLAMQDATSGGWAMDATAKPSTTATAWSVMAMKSAHMAYLQVSRKAVQRAAGFFDRVRSDGGAFYGEFKPGKDPRATAAALFCRMCLGWRRDNPALVRGVQYLGQIGPSKSAPLFNYFATKSLYAWQGAEWKTWNGKMRDSLVADQSHKGHEAGSWTPDEGTDAGCGGRLWQTSINAAILGVYYSHFGSPRPPDVEQEFPD